MNCPILRVDLILPLTSLLLHVSHYFILIFKLAFQFFDLIAESADVCIHVLLLISHLSDVRLCLPHEVFEVLLVFLQLVTLPDDCKLLALAVLELIFELLAEDLVLLLLLNTLFNEVEELILLCLEFPLLVSDAFKLFIELLLQSLVLSSLVIQLGMVTSGKVSLFAFLQSLKLFEVGNKLGIVSSQ